ncbi:26S proteasome non-ATPase regulatory subunit 10-like isoform X2 [Dreissena polymorpha]|nr:26S proteasome non-ATPase regulatory subunit 10-like isoform X2 [Dreissena polymorpha]KAH3816886.1 hypothetical protein DPMN_118410 [Dreissena polymorpha]
MEYHGMLNQRVLTAMQKRDIEKVQQLLLMPNYDLNYASQKRITPLILASQLGLFTVCKKLVTLKVDLGLNDLDGRTALHHSCYHGNKDVADLLIKAGANISVVSNEGDTPLHEAISSGHFDTVELLIQAGSDVNRPNHVTGSAPLDLAVLHERSEVTRLLIKNGANVHYRSRAKETALHYAVQVASMDIIQQLLDAGADLNSLNNIGESPLTVAIQERKLSVVKFLVETGCRLDHTDSLSPMYIACRQNSQDIICFLLSEGFNVSADRYLMRYTYLHLVESNPQLLEAIFHRIENPASLKEHCRTVIRKALRPNMMGKITKLSLPKLMKVWIQTDNIYS